MDGGRAGNAPQMKTTHTYLPPGQIGITRTQIALAQPKSWKVIYEEESVDARVGRLRNAFGTMHEGQHIQIFTAPGFELEIKQRLFWESTTRYSHIFPVKLPPHTSAWQVTNVML